MKLKPGIVSKFAAIQKQEMSLHFDMLIIISNNIHE